MAELLPANPRVDAFRRFNRFYTARIGALREGLLDSAFTLAEARLLWELAHRGGATAAELSRQLDLDPGYLSRLLSGLKKRRLLSATRSARDGRIEQLALSAAGRRAFAPLDARSRAQVEMLLAALSDDAQQQLLASMARIERLLWPGDADAPELPQVVLRPHRAGDIGWVVARHAAIYADAYGWDARFEALVARIGAAFIDGFDAAREACWIAERGAVRLGCVVLVQARDDDAGAAPIDGVAQLRLLLVEPSERGVGLGARLVEQCSSFARDAGYRRIRLWTQRNLVAARALYTRAGYRLERSEAHRSFGHELVAEIWELTL